MNFKLVTVLSLSLLLTKTLLPNPHTQNLKLGLENFGPKVINKLSINKKTKIGLITNYTGIDQQKRRNIDLLIKRHLNLVTIFVPEHGLEGKILAAKNVPNSIDAKSKIKVLSLYKDFKFKPIEEKLDVLIFDIQDCGMRHYTYISTLYRILEYAAKNNKTIIVLDRPNPIGGNMEGPLVEKELISFISIAPIPVRHGMTVGELAKFFNNNVLTEKANLHIVKMSNYKRAPYKILTPLSPNIPNTKACYGYSFLGLLGEVSPFKIGVGTNKPFQSIYIPNFNKWYNLNNILVKQGITSTVNNGLQITKIDINKLHSIQTFLDILDFFKSKNIEFNFAKTFDKAIGTILFKKYLLGEISKKELTENINTNLKIFYSKAKNYFLYTPGPKLLTIH